MPNENYRLEIGAPLLRPGMKLLVGPLSDLYASEIMLGAMRIVRAFNNAEVANVSPLTKAQFDNMMDNPVLEEDADPTGHRNTVPQAENGGIETAAGRE